MPRVSQQFVIHSHRTWKRTSQARAAALTTSSWWHRTSPLLPSQHNRWSSTCTSRDVSEQRGQALTHCDALALVLPATKSPLQAAPAAQSVEPAAKRARLDSQAAATSAADGAGAAAPVGTLMQQVERNERRLWDRNSAMTVPGKSFARVVQLARDVLYANNKRPEPVRSSSRPQHRVSTVANMSHRNMESTSSLAIEAGSTKSAVC